MCRFSVPWVIYCLLVIGLWVVSAQPIVGAAERLFRAGSYAQTTGLIEESGYEIPFETSGESSGYVYPTYVYEVGGRVYRSDRISFLEPDFSMARASWSVDAFPPDGQVTVYYDPRWPGRSVLRMDVTVGEAVATLSVYGTIWLLLILAGWGLVAVTLRANRVCEPRLRR